MTGPLRLGTRGSALALWQAGVIRAALGTMGAKVELVEITTTGDGWQDRPFSAIGDTALFTRQLDDALLEGRIDLAVHSLKDLPSRLPDGIALAAVSEREDPRDALVARPGLSWASLPERAVVATCSVRRRAQVLAARPDLVIADLRGNVPTRLERFDQQLEWHAILLATAGLARLGLAGRITERLDPELMLPAPGQGALAVTTRSGDPKTSALVSRVVNDDATALAVIAERTVLGELDGGCQVPIAALATRSNGRLALRAKVLTLDGRQFALAAGSTAELSRSGATELGRRIAEDLRREGAERLLADCRAGSPPREARTR